MIGIYKITNKLNGKVYVGQSCDLERRLKRHLYDLKLNKHINSHLQSSFNKNGEGAFEAEILCVCEEVSELSALEIKWIKELSSFGKGYNSTPGGESGYFSFLGKEHSSETKAKMKITRANQIITDEHKGNISASLLGRKRAPFTEEHKRKISDANKGKKRTPEQIERMVEGRTGFKFSEESKKKMSESAKGRKMSSETKKKVSESKRIPFTKEQEEEIKRRLNAGESCRSIAKDFNCSHVTIIRRFKN